MKVYWKESRIGLRLVLADEQREDEVGGIRQTRSGYDAFAKTVGYEPGRAQKGIPTLEEAKAFVESFSPWELYEAGRGLSVDPDVKPLDS